MISRISPPSNLSRLWHRRVILVLEVLVMFIWTWPLALLWLIMFFPYWNYMALPASLVCLNWLTMVLTSFLSDLLILSYLAVRSLQLAPDRSWLIISMWTPTNLSPYLFAPMLYMFLADWKQLSRLILHFTTMSALFALFPYLPWYMALLTLNLWMYDSDV